MGTPLKMVGGLMVGGLVLGMAGCSVGSETTDGGGGAAASPSVESETAVETPAFHFKSGDLPLGEFDPWTIGENLFNPCAEISEEEFAAVGLTGMQDLGYDPVRQVHGCTFATENSDTALGVVANAVNWGVLNGSGTKSGPLESSIPGTYFSQNITGPADCATAVDTVRGGLAVSIATMDPTATLEQSCAAAREKLESLYHLGK